MNSLSPRSLALVCLTGLACSGSSLADPYFGGASGRARMDDYAPLSGTFVDSDATSEKYFFGLRLGHHFRVEVAQVNFGQLDGAIPGQLDLDGTSYSALFETGVGRSTHAFLRLGRFDWDGIDRGAVVPVNQHGNDGLWGVGLTWEVSRNILLRAEWERYDLGPYEVDMPSLGLIIEL